MYKICHYSINAEVNNTFIMAENTVNKCNELPGDLGKVRDKAVS